MVIARPRHVRPTTSPIEVEMFAEVEAHVKVQQELCPKSRTADAQELLLTVIQCDVLLVTQPYPDMKSRLGQSSKPLAVVLSGDQSVFERTFHVDI